MGTEADPTAAHWSCPTGSAGPPSLDCPTAPTPPLASSGWGQRALSLPPAPPPTAQSRPPPASPLRRQPLRRLARTGGLYTTTEESADRREKGRVRMVTRAQWTVRVIQVWPVWVVLHAAALTWQSVHSGGRRGRCGSHLQVRLRRRSARRSRSRHGLRVWEALGKMARRWRGRQVGTVMRGVGGAVRRIRRRWLPLTRRIRRHRRAPYVTNVLVIRRDGDGT